MGSHQRWAKTSRPSSVPQLRPVLSSLGGQVQAHHALGTPPHYQQRKEGHFPPHMGERDLLSKVHGCLLCLTNTGEIGTLGILAEIPGLGWVTCCYLTSSKLLSL